MQIPTRARGLYLLAIGLVALSIAACGDDDDNSGSAADETTEATTTEQAPASSGGNATTLDIDATENGGLGFSKTKLNARAGDVTVSMANPEGNQAPHAIEVEGNGIEEVGETVQAGGTSTVTANLKPGKYTFYCPVGDHREQGMEGTLTVR